MLKVPGKIFATTRIIISQFPLINAINHRLLSSAAFFRVSIQFQNTFLNAAAHALTFLYT